MFETNFMIAEHIHLARNPECNIWITPQECGNVTLEEYNPVNLDWIFLPRNHNWSFVILKTLIFQY